MKKAFLAVVAATVTFSVCTSASHAEGSRSVGIAVFGGYGTYSMADVNDAIQSPGALFPGTTIDADEISGGAMFGGGFRFRRSNEVTLALEVSRLLAKTTGTAVFLGNPYDGELSIPATNVSLTVQYLLPSSGAVRAGLGLGAGYYFCAGDLKATNGGFSVSSDVDGSGFGFHALGLGDARLSGGVHLEVGAGYRYARTTDIELDGGVLRNLDGSKTKIDWSGFVGRVGLIFYFKSSPAAEIRTR